VPPRQAVARHGKPKDDRRRIGATVLRQAPFARGLVRLGTRGQAAFNHIVFTVALVQLIAFKMHRRGIVEEPLHIQSEQVGKAAIPRLFYLFLLGFKQVHGPGEMVQGQRSGSGKADFLAPPLFVAVELGTGCTSSVGHHGKEGTLEGKVDFTGGELL
jgi:hypothetical protein